MYLFGKEFILVKVWLKIYATKHIIALYSVIVNSTPMQMVKKSHTTHWKNVENMLIVNKYFLWQDSSMNGVFLITACM